jgi:predicted aldo/keto reductase-like oxidoreductase
MSNAIHQTNCEPLIKNEKNMRYRKFGSTGLEVSALSFGCMRLQDDKKLNSKLISSAIDLGINYFETTRHYLGGTCQHRVAPGLKGKTAGIIVSGKEGLASWGLA